MNAEEIAERIASGDVQAAREALSLLGTIGKRFGMSKAGSVVRALRGIARGQATVIRKVDDWEWAVDRMLMSNAKACQRSLMSEWDRKIATMVKGLALRRRDSVSSTGLLRSKVYKSKTWEECIERLQQKANHGQWRGRADPWVKWSMTVAKNHNRRWEGRHAKGKSRNGQGQRVAGNAGEAAIPLRVQWAKSHARNRKR